MTRSWQYPRWRRMLMQATLVLILAATVGLAEFITRQRNKTDAPELKQLQTIDRLLVSLPVGWDVNQDDPNELIAQEPAINAQARTLIIRVFHIPNVKSAEEFLRSSGLLNGALIIRNEVDDPRNDPLPDPNPQTLQSIPMAGQQGIMTSVLRAERSLPELSPTLHNQLIAATLLPPQTQIVLQLDTTEKDLDGDDERLVKKIAAALTIQAETTP